MDCAKIYFNGDEISPKKVIKMVNNLCPLVKYIADGELYNKTDFPTFIITFDRELCESTDAMEIMFNPYKYHAEEISPVYINNDFYNSRNLNTLDRIKKFYDICQAIKPDMLLDSLIKILFTKTNGNAYEMFEKSSDAGEIVKAMRIDADEIYNYGIFTRSGTKLHILNDYLSYHKRRNMTFDQLADLTECVKKQHPGLYILKRGNKQDWTWEVFFDGAIVVDENMCKMERIVSTEENNITYIGDLSIKNYNDFVQFSECHEDEDDFITQSLVMIFTTLLGVNKKAFEKYNEFAKP